MSTVLGLREFTHIRWDPRVLLVDARQTDAKQVRPLDNPFFSWVRINSRPQIYQFASDISQRHLIVIHKDEECALDFDQIFKSLEIRSAALEDGERGWFNAILEEQMQEQGDALFVTLNRIAFNQRQYLIVHGSRAIALQPSGSIAALREEARHYGAHIEAVVDVGRRRRTAEQLATALGVQYFSAEAFDVGGAPREICGIHLRRTQTDSIEIANRSFLQVINIAYTH